jgi:GTP cyclohydrolase I
MTASEDVRALELLPDPEDVNRVIDVAAGESAASDFLVALEADINDEHLAETPHRMAKAYADLLTPRRLQVQERLTTQIAGWLQQQLEPKGAGVVLEAEHMCMALRGVQTFGPRS